MRVSLVDVAVRAGVSPGTVSHVLNGNAAARIAPATQDRIRRIAEEMGYRPNMFARGLLGKPTKTLGFLVAGLENPFYVGVSKALEGAARDAGYQLLLYATIAEPWVYPEYKIRSSLLVDGMFVWSRDRLDLTELLGAPVHPFPIVYLGYEGPGPMNFAAFDLYAGARSVMEYLVDRGYRRIAYLQSGWATGEGPVDPRTRVYAEVCAEARLEPEYVVLEAGVSATAAGLRAGLTLGARPARERPEALFCYNDVMAIGVCQGLRRAGLRVPEDIGVTGFDGIELGQCLDVPLTTVLSPPEPLAAAAVDILLRRLFGESDAQPKGVTIPTTLLVGRTTR